MLTNGEKPVPVYGTQLQENDCARKRTAYGVSTALTISTGFSLGNFVAAFFMEV